MAESKKTLSQVSVRGTGDNGKVVLWERHPDHPKPVNRHGKEAKVGEAFISNDGKSRIVAETARVKELIGLGRLELAKAGSEVKKTEDDKKGDTKPKV